MNINDISYLFDQDNDKALSDLLDKLYSPMDIFFKTQNKWDGGDCIEYPVEYE